MTALIPERVDSDGEQDANSQKSINSLFINILSNHCCNLLL
jgi:hypothetical protein